MTALLNAFNSVHLKILCTQYDRMSDIGIRKLMRESLIPNIIKMGRSWFCSQNSLNETCPSRSGSTCLSTSLLKSIELLNFAFPSKIIIFGDSLQIWHLKQLWTSSRLKYALNAFLMSCSLQVTHPTFLHIHDINFRKN